MRRFRKEFGLKKARILRERLIPVSQGLKIGINRQPLIFCAVMSRAGRALWAVSLPVSGPHAAQEYHNDYHIMRKREKKNVGFDQSGK